MRGRSRFSMLAVVIVVVVLGVAGTVALQITPWASALDIERQTAPPESSTAGTPNDDVLTDPELAIVLDASSSMRLPDEGRTRLDVAKAAAHELIDELPETSRVGMLAYGTRISDAPENHAAGCEDIRTLAPVDVIDKDRLRAEVDQIEAHGYTPIGSSLRAAADALSTDATERAIVLVSDGIETCAPPPPCDVAAELADEGVGLAIHVVGFHADQATRAQLECIAEVTGGSYRPADDAASLTDSLKLLAQRVIVGYDTHGTQFELANTPDEALYLGEGLYRTSMETSTGAADGHTPARYILLAVPEGHRAWVSLTPLPVIDLDVVGGGHGVKVELSAENTSGDGCTSTSDLSHTSGAGFQPPESAVIAIEAEDGDDQCDHTKWEVAAQTLTTAHGDVEDLELEMSVQFEPFPGDDSATWPAGDEGNGEAAAPVDTANPQQVSGGTSFSSAGEIAEGAVADAIVPGEFRYYRFPVEWGERPVVTVRTGPSVQGAADSVSVAVYGPVRHKVADDYGRFREDSGELTIATDRPVNFHNRDANSQAEDAAIAGDHYLAVSMNVTDSGAKGVEQPFEVGIRMDGQPGPGPDWTPVNTPGPAPAWSPITGEASEPSHPGPADDQVTAQDEDPGQVGWIVSVGIALVLLVLTVSGWWFCSRGKAARSADAPGA